MTAWIALTGGIGSGKSQAARYFQILGVPVIDADAINRHIITTPHHPALQAIVAHFGAQALDEHGRLNRAQMRQQIFSDPHAKQQLEHILHPHIIAGIRAEQSQYPHAHYGIVELPTLSEHPHFRPLVQRVLLIHSDEYQRIERVKQRSGLSETEIRAIIATQASDAQRLALADDVLDNTGDLNALAQAVQTQHQDYISLYKRKAST